MQPSMDYRNIADRLTRLNARITDSERVAGVAWYHRANDTVWDIASTYQLHIDVVAAVIAALSPNIRWSQNVRAARTMIDAFDAGESQPVVAGYTANRKKAWAILETGDTSILSGPKVEAFAANLRGDLDYVTVDMWAMRAIGGSPDRITRAIQHNVVLGYKKAAHRANMPPAEFQAVVWVHVRGNAN